MHKICTLLITLSLFSSLYAGTPLTLPAHATDGGKPLMQTLAERPSTRDFSTDTAVSDTVLSNLLWAANGVNRPDGYRTAPSALNKQEIDLYVFTAQGAWLYRPAEHSLLPCADGDHRELFSAGQDFAAKAPLIVLMVANGERFGSTDSRSQTMMAVDAGIVCQNINLFCASEGLKTVPRASMDAEALRALLNLPDTHTPLLNNPIGY